VDNLWITYSANVNGLKRGGEMSGSSGTGRSSSADLMSEIEAGGDDEALALLEQRLAALGVDAPGELSEAERAALTASPPALTQGGEVRGRAQQRPLTPAQVAFAQGVISGMSRRAAYRAAYPNAKGSDATISACAHRLCRDSRIARLIETGWTETAEALAEDQAAAARYVMRSLVAMSKAGRQEGSRLKALELLGRATGLWRDQQRQQQPTATADQLRAELAQHLRALRVVQGGKRTG